MVLFGCLLLQIPFLKESPGFILTTSAYPGKQRTLFNENVIYQNATINQFRPSEFASNLPDGTDYWDVTYYQPTDQTKLFDFYNKVFEERTVGSPKPYRFGSYEIYQADKDNHIYQVNSYLNLTSSDVTEFFPYYMYESIIRTATNSPTKKVTVNTEPYPLLYLYTDRISQGYNIDFAFIVSIGLALIPSVIVSFILKEREQ
jgi:hypothetical protein